MECRAYSYKVIQGGKALPARARVQRRADFWAGVEYEGGQIFVQHPTLRKGDTGDSVTYLQTLLCSVGDPITVDGAFGPETADAVKAFQKANGLTVDGVVGPMTWDALEKATGHHGDEGTNAPGKSDTVTISMADWNAIRAAVAVLAQAVRKYEGGDTVG